MRKLSSSEVIRGGDALGVRRQKKGQKCFFYKILAKYYEILKKVYTVLVLHLRSSLKPNARPKD